MSDVFGVKGRMRCRQAMYSYLFASCSIVSWGLVVFCLKVKGDRLGWDGQSKREEGVECIRTAGSGSRSRALRCSAVVEGGMKRGMQWLRGGYLFPSVRTCSSRACRQHNSEEQGHRLVQHRSCLPIVIVMMTIMTMIVMMMMTKMMSERSCMQFVTERNA